MRHTLLAMALLCLLSTTCLAQSICGADPSDTNALYLGTFNVSVPLSTVVGPGTNLAATCDIISDVCVWLTGAGRVDYVINAVSIQLGGDCDGVVDSMSASAIFALLAHSAVEKGIALGYSECSDSCSQMEMARVYSSTCVQRIGSGDATLFVPCDSDSYCWRSYAICCSEVYGEPEVVALPGYNGNCSGELAISCEPTCGSSEYSVQERSIK